MVESGLLADGSLNGLIEAFHFNRCKRIHPAVALSFRILHFKIFLDTYEVAPHDTKLSLQEMIEILHRDTHMPNARQTTIFELQDVLSCYEEYTMKTLNGEHGHTAKYVLSYVRFVETFQLFERAIRTSDLDLYIYAGYQMCPLYFIANHQNYARWFTRNLDDLMNIDETHPGLRDEFENGALSIRRTSKSFCRSPIDLTLEQTINANAANKLTGISSFTNSLSARQKWSETYTLRMSIITELIDFLDLAKSNDDSKNGYQSKIFTDQVNKFLNLVSENIDPFSDELNRAKLFNLSTGKAAKEDTTYFLMNFEDNGTKQMKTFIEECKADHKRFDRPLKKNSIKNFSMELVKNKNSTFKNINHTKMESNILIQVFCLAMKKEIQLRSLLSFPLTTVPHSLAHFDGSMISHQKGELTKILISKVNQQNNQSIIPDVDIVDGFNLLNSFGESPTKYGHFATFVLSRICDTPAQEVHVLFDKREGPSPRDVDIKKKRELFDFHTVNFIIKGPQQERGHALSKCLASSSFRDQIVNFFIEYWSNDNISKDILMEKRVFVSVGSKCYLFANQHEKGKLVSSFENNHFEIDSKVILHLAKIRAKNIRVQTANPDNSLVSLLYHMQFWDQEREVVLETGNVHKNNYQKINVRQVFRALSPAMINALPSWNTFTGCIYEPSFFAKGKKTCLKALEKSVEAQNVFGKIGNVLNQIGNDEITVLEEYTCSLYGHKSSDVNQVRTSIFEKGHESGIDLKKTGKTLIAIETKFIFTELIK